jgi:RNA polymerase sigma-70 factor (ECF subfamily)
VAQEFSTPSDEELARSTQAGSLDAFEELVRRYEGRLYGFLANSCHTEADAREVTQDTFVRAFQAIAQFDPRRSFAPWLFAIARRKAIDRHRATPPADAGEPLPELCDYDDPAELLARREDGQGLWQFARGLLPETQFEALWLRYAEDMSVADLAPVLRKTQTHVKVLLFRARQTLGDELERRRATDFIIEPRFAKTSRRHPGFAPV